MDRHGAEQYRAQLGEVTGLPFSLPAEAQWEYAVYNRGKYMVAPVDDGAIRIGGQKGTNIATATDWEIYACRSESFLDVAPLLPRDFRPPNPLRTYDIAGNGWEWMRDWYDLEYYSHSPIKDPQGSGQPVFGDADGYYMRALCSQGYPGPGRGLAMVCHKIDSENRGYPPADKTVRYAANHPSPVK